MVDYVVDYMVDCMVHYMVDFMVDCMVHYMVDYMVVEEGVYAQQHVDQPDCLEVMPCTPEVLAGSLCCIRGCSSAGSQPCSNVSSSLGRCIAVSDVVTQTPPAEHARVWAADWRFLVLREARGGGAGGGGGGAGGGGVRRSKVWAAILPAVLCMLALTNGAAVWNIVGTPLSTPSDRTQLWLQQGGNGLSLSHVQASEVCIRRKTRLVSTGQSVPWI